MAVASYSRSLSGFMASATSCTARRAIGVWDSSSMGPPSLSVQHGYRSFSILHRRLWVPISNQQGGQCQFYSSSTWRCNHVRQLQPPGALHLRGHFMERFKVLPISGHQIRTFSWKHACQNNNDSKKDSLSSTSKKILSKLPMSTHENIYTIPNILTFSRLVAAPMVGYFILNSNHVLALSFFAYAAITDLIDGYIARKYNQQTVVGTVIDPMADKILMTVGVVCLAMKSAIPVWLAAIILARDVGLGFAAIYYRWISLPPPKTMARYWDFSLPSAEVKPTGVSKVNTALQVLLLGSAMAAPVVPEVILSSWGLQEGLIGLQYLVALTTTWSGLQYVYLKDTVKILKHNRK